MLLRHARDSGHESPLDPCAEAARRAVRADGDLVAGADLEPLRVLCRELDLGGGSLERELRDALDRGAREERPVADEAQAATLRRRGDGGWLDLSERLATAQVGPLAHLAVGQPAEDPLRELPEHDRRVWRDLDAEALREPGDPGELVGRRWHDRTAEALQAGPQGH